MGRGGSSEQRSDDGDGCCCSGGRLQVMSAFVASPSVYRDLRAAKAAAASSDQRQTAFSLGADVEQQAELSLPLDRARKERRRAELSCCCVAFLFHQAASLSPALQLLASITFHPLLLLLRHLSPYGPSYLTAVTSCSFPLLSTPFFPSSLAPRSSPLPSSSSQP